MRHGAGARLLGLFLQVIMLAGCQAPSPPAQAQVTVDLFSGRPDNPTWALSPDQVSELIDRLAQLEASSEAREAPGHLGYRGVWVELRRTGEDPAERWLVYSGLAACESDSGGQVLADPQRALEQWLVQTGQPYVDAQLFGVIQAELHVSLP